jgi:chromosome segregation ATPase
MEVKCPLQACSEELQHAKENIAALADRERSSTVRLQECSRAVNEQAAQLRSNNADMQSLEAALQELQGEMRLTFETADSWSHRCGYDSI